MESKKIFWKEDLARKVGHRKVVFLIFSQFSFDEFSAETFFRKNSIKKASTRIFVLLETAFVLKFLRPGEFSANSTSRRLLLASIPADAWGREFPSFLDFRFSLISNSQSDVIYILLSGFRYLKNNQSPSRIRTFLMTREYQSQRNELSA